MKRARLKSPTDSDHYRHWAGRPVKQRCRFSVPDWSRAESEYLAANPPTEAEWAWVTDNYRLLVKIVKEHCKGALGRSCGYDDVIGFCLPVVVKCLRGYDPSTGYALGSYVGTAVRQRAYWYRDRNRASVVPLFRGLPRNTSVLTGDREVIVEEPAPDEDRDDLLDNLTFALGSLKGRDRAVVDGYLGLSGPRKTLMDLSEELGVTRERIRQVFMAAMLKVIRRAKLKRQVVPPFTRSRGSVNGVKGSRSAFARLTT